MWIFWIKYEEKVLKLHALTKKKKIKVGECQQQ